MADLSFAHGSCGHFLHLFLHLLHLFLHLLHLCPQLLVLINSTVSLRLNLLGLF
jgi:hypothetical protein